MKKLLTFIMTLLMPFVLIIGGGTVGGWSITNDLPIIGWIGISMVFAGLAWGLFLWLWVNAGTW